MVTEIDEPTFGAVAEQLYDRLPEALQRLDAKQALPVAREAVISTAPSEVYNTVVNPRFYYTASAWSGINGSVQRMTDPVLDKNYGNIIALNPESVGMQSDLLTGPNFTAGYEWTATVAVRASAGNTRVGVAAYNASGTLLGAAYKPYVPVPDTLTGNAFNTLILQGIVLPPGTTQGRVIVNTDTTATGVRLQATDFLLYQSGDAHDVTTGVVPSGDGVYLGPAFVLV